MKILLATITLLLLGIFICSAQGKGNVSVHADARLSILINKTKAPEPDEEQARPAPSAKKITPPNEPAKSVKHTSKPENVAMRTGEVIQPQKQAPKEPILTTAPKPLAVAASPTGARQFISWSPGGKYKGKGYRVQIYYGPNRYEALRRKAEFMRNYPGVNTYFTFESPTYRVKVGNFRNRDEATGMYREASSSYSPCMIVPDMVFIK